MSINRHGAPNPTLLVNTPVRPVSAQRLVFLTRVKADAAIAL
jgi:hypothetical protein